MERIENILDDKCSKVFATEILDIGTGLTVRTINYNSKICMEISANEPICRLMYSGIDKSPNGYINTLASKHEVLRYDDSPIHDTVELFLGEKLTRYVNKIFMDVQSRDDIEEIENILLLDIKSTVNNLKTEFKFNINILTFVENFEKKEPIKFVEKFNFNYYCKNEK